MEKFANIAEIKSGKVLKVTSEDYANYVINLLDSKQVDKVYVYKTLYLSIWRSRYALFDTTRPILKGHRKQRPVLITSSRKKVTYYMIDISKYDD